VTQASPFLAAAVRTATPLALAALGELITERGGMINISLEGSIIAGAFGAFTATAAFGLAGGYVAGAAAGLLVGLVFAVFVVALRADQIVVGAALTMAALGLTGTLYRGLYGAVSVLPSISTSAPHAVPWLVLVPWLGPAFFRQPWDTYLAYGLVPSIWWFLYRTHAGLALRAVGDAPHAAAVAGVVVGRVRTLAVAFGGMVGGLAGATLVLAQAGTFAESMSAGRGFIAIAIVALGRWHPAGVFMAALVFGAAMAVQFVVQSLGWHLRYELVLMAPYVLTLIALVFAGRGSAPAWLGRSAVDLN
jgi:general nucleoside transport system permease protein